MIISHSDDSVSVYDMTGKKMYQGKTGFDLDLKINSDYTLNSVMEITQSDGNTVDFTGAKGVYSAKNGDIYIADTLNARIII